MPKAADTAAFRRKNEIRKARHGGGGQGEEEAANENSVAAISDRRLAGTAAGLKFGFCVALVETRSQKLDNLTVIPRIRELLHSIPFQPFLIRTSDGREYAVPTSDHAAIHPRGSYVVIFSDGDSHADIAGFHLASVVKQIQQ